MPYRSDCDLNFLEQCDNDDLGVLVDIIRGKEGDLRKTEALTLQNNYKKYYPDHTKYWREIAEELQRFGGHSWINTLRGKGVLYGEILADVCGKLDVPDIDGKSVSEKETLLLSHLLQQSIQKMSEQERRELLANLNIPSADFSKQATVAAIQGAVFAGSFVSYQVAVVVANAVARALLGRGLGLATNAALTRTIGIVSGPIGWFLTGLWTVVEIGGPAYRVTIPACVQIAYLRAKQLDSARQSVAPSEVSTPSAKPVSKSKASIVKKPRRKLSAVKQKPGQTRKTKRKVAKSPVRKSPRRR